MYSFKPATIQLPAVRDRLLDLISAFFNADNELEAADFKLYLGLFLENAKPIIPFEGKRAERAAKLGYRLRYTLMTDPRAARIINPDIYPIEVTGSQCLARMPDESFKPLYLDFMQRRADAVWDDKDEMLKCDFAFASVVTKQSRETRRKNLSRQLDQILLPADLRDYGSSTWDFHGELARDATYKAEDGTYYPKWLAQKPESQKDRIYSFDTLSDQYLQLNFGELVVRKGGNYLLLILDGDRAVFEMELKGNDKHPEFRLTPIITTELSMTRLVERASSAKSREAVFFHAVHGTEKKHRVPKKTSSKMRNPGTKTFVVDPKAMVESKRGKLPAKETSRWSDWDWFVEMVKSNFPERVFDIYIGGMEMFNNLGLFEREQLFLNSFAKLVDISKGPFKAAVETVLEALKKDPDILIFARSAPIGQNLRLIGTDETWVYLYSTKTRLTLCQRTGDFVFDLNVGYTINQVYENTKHIIPMTKLLLWGALGVMGGGVLGVGALVVRGGQAAYSVGRTVVMRGRSFLVSTGINTAFRETAIEAYKRLRPQLIAMLIGGFLHFVPNRGKVPSFIAGVLIGFSWDALDRMADKYTGLVTGAIPGYSQYKTYKFIRKLIATVQKVEDKIEELADKIDDQVSEELADRLTRAPNHLLAGMMVLFGCLLLLDYKHVKPFLDEAAKQNKQKPITQKEWEELGKKYLTQRADALAAQAIDLAKAKTVEEAKEYIAKHQAHIILGLLTGVSALLTAGTPIFWVFFLTYVPPFALLDIFGNNADITLGLANMLADPIRNMDRYTDDEVERYGRFLGHILGGIVIDRQIFKEGTYLGNLKKSHNPLVQRLIIDRLQHGLLLPVVRFVLSHQLILLERLQKNAPKYKEKLDAAYQRILYRADPDLSEFAPPEDRRISFHKLVEMLTEIDEILILILKDLAETPDLDKKLAAMAEDMQLPFISIASGAVPPVEVVYVMVGNLRGAISEIAKALSLLFTPLRDDGKTPSIADILQIIGLDIGTTEADAVLAQDLEAQFPDESALPSESIPVPAAAE